MFSLFINQWLADETIRALSWTFIHSLWQGLIAAALAAIIIAATRRSSARLRYNLLGSVIIGFMLVTAITFGYQHSTVSNTLPVAKTDISLITIAAQNVGASISVGGQRVDMMDMVTSFLNRNAEWLMMAWFLFFVIKCTRLITGLHYTYRIRYHNTHEPSPKWKRKIIELSKYIDIHQTIRLMESEMVKMPAAVGYFKPVILVPLGMLTNLTPAQAETILLHELAHIRRRDYIVNLIQSCMETIFFFNPAVIWISSLIREEREACCDDIVMENTVAKSSYLEALVSFHEHQGQATYAMALGHNRMHLLNRVKRMLTRENKKLTIMEKLVLLAGITLFTAFSFIPTNEPGPNTGRSVISKGIKRPVSGSSAKPYQPEVTVAQNSALVKRGKQSIPGLAQINVNTRGIDTVPSPAAPIRKEKMTEAGFSSMSVNKVKDDTKDEQTIEATEKGGKKYRIKKINGKLSSFSIDDVEIPENEWKDHKEDIERIETTARAKPAPPKPFTGFKSVNGKEPLQPKSAKKFETHSSFNYEAKKFKAYPVTADTTKYSERKYTEHRKTEESRLLQKRIFVNRDSIAMARQRNSKQQEINRREHSALSSLRQDSIKPLNKQLKVLKLEKKDIIRNEMALSQKRTELKRTLLLEQKKELLLKRQSQELQKEPTPKKRIDL